MTGFAVVPLRLNAATVVVVLAGSAMVEGAPKEVA